MTNLKFGYPPMGVVFGQINFTKKSIGYDLIKQYCIGNLTKTQTDYPNNKIISTGQIVNLKVYNTEDSELVGIGNSIEGMNSDNYTITILGLDSETFEKQFPKLIANMNRNNQKEPLYRKVNTKARNVHHNFGGDFKNSRHKKKETLEQTKGTMYGKKERGLDYTPLFRFLLSKVGSNWNEIFSEAKSRLDKTEPIFWMVALDENDKKDFIRLGEATYFSGLYVDNEGILQLSNPKLEATDLKHYCECCTHTFNGQVY